MPNGDEEPPYFSSAFDFGVLWFGGSIVVFFLVFGRVSPAAETLGTVRMDAEQVGFCGGHLVFDDSVEFFKISGREPGFLTIVHQYDSECSENTGIY